MDQIAIFSGASGEVAKAYREWMAEHRKGSIQVVDRLMSTVTYEDMSRRVHITLAIFYIEKPKGRARITAQLAERQKSRAA
jgi:hypothetical protein